MPQSTDIMNVYGVVLLKLDIHSFLKAVAFHDKIEEIKGEEVYNQTMSVPGESSC